MINNLKRLARPYSSLITRRTASTSPGVNSIVGWTCAACSLIAAIISSSVSALVFQSQSTPLIHSDLPRFHCWR